MGKPVDFFTDGAKRLYKEMDGFEARGLDKSRAFTDFITMVTCALANPTMEKEYLDVVKRYPRKKNENIGEGAIDIFPRMFAVLVDEMDKVSDEKTDILGDLFQGAITFGEHGQFFTPDPVCRLMADIVAIGQQINEPYVNDCACGSGRTLLATARHSPNAIFVGQDIDYRCALMTSINFALYGLNGYVIWGNTLSWKIWDVYQISWNGKNILRKVDPKKFQFPPGCEPKSVESEILEQDHVEISENNISDKIPKLQKPEKLGQLSLSDFIKT
ncbi:N-6 DNA methylase [Methanococcus maripaludis]|uniref:site-specific DNA-methyltransferase (adenine-specific) n=1 Tax=Methanococcus maripaludis TaxID=39152 RepID=A0A8T4CL79_METMI|nr:N-6 DNA methylase [Methanococcus maripaludis]MBM7408748.1 hypothetical protein [Methanococcus maripaludis]MBP2219083.1 hypothetical protein [Methanococcus maripaludis]